ENHITISSKEKPCQPKADGVINFRLNTYYLFTFLASSVPALNFATFFALILISFPVRGLRPLRAARLETENVPKPTKVTLPPFDSVAPTPLMKESRASAA